MAKAPKFIKTSPDAAYEIAVGVTDPQEAADLGLAVVESTATGQPASYGRYIGAPGGAPLGITVDKAGETEVIGGGGVNPNTAPAVAGQKGEVVNQDDPFVHGGSDMHADGGTPPAELGTSVVGDEKPKK